MIGIFTLKVLYSIFFYKQHSVKIPLHLQSPFKKLTRRDNTSTFKPWVFGQKILCDNFSPEKTLRYRRPS